MTKHDNPANLSRRAVLMGAGALVVSVGAPVGIELLTGISEAYAQGAKPPLTPDQLSSYIAVNADGTVSAFFGKMDMGHGLFVAIGQIVAEELDVPFKAVKVYMGDTATSVNQGGASGSTGIQFGGKQMRMAAAEARRVLLEMAAQKLGSPTDQLIVVNGQISAAFNRDKKTSYAELIGGQYFNVQLDWNKQMGNALYAPGKAQPKKHTEHKIVGQPIKREDVAPKVFAQEDFVVDIKVPGMVHGRVIRPAIAGAVPVKIDESSVKDIPGVQVVHQNGFLGVVAPKEWDAIKAMQQLKVEWSKVEPPFPNQNALYDHIRKAPVRKSATEGKTAGNVDEAFKTADYVRRDRFKIQRHAAMFMEPRGFVAEWDAAAGKPRAARVARYDQLVLSSHPVAVDPVAAVPIVWRAWVARERTDDERLVIHRLRFAGDEAPFADIVRQLEAGGVDHADADAPPVPDWWTSLDQGDTPVFPGLFGTASTVVGASPRAVCR